MASPINCLSILVIPLLVTSLFYQVSAGPPINDAFLRTVCQKTKDPGFCFSTLKADPRTFEGPADEHHLAIVSVTIVIDTVQVTVDQIPGILSGIRDPRDRTRLENCQQDFKDALAISRNAYASSAWSNYVQSKSNLIDATNKIVDCDNSYKTPPVRVSPIADACTNVIKKTGIAVAVMDTVSA